MWAEGKTAWVTGASAGIGERLAHEMMRAGAAVVLSARTESDLARVAGDLALMAREVMHEAPVERADGAPENTLVLPLDMREPARFDDAVRAVRERYGRLDHLILNAGVSQRGYVAETTREIDDILIRTNYLGPAALARAALPLLMEGGGGRITVVSSVLGKYGTVS
ncbi:MAG: SDR family NAD(P)-dependent oxidoreductase, partial [Gemmatimonadetes bacterium]|nr:SDR family NAD(P)-dependent oxidoreductase [Gemmatimonadota bacterium]